LPSIWKGVFVEKMGTLHQFKKGEGVLNLGYLALILFFLAENNGAWFVLLNLLGILFAIGRASHAYGISQINENFRFQIFGMVITFTAITGLYLTNLILIFIKL